MSAAIVAALAFAASSPQAAIAAIYAPYTHQPNATASWEYPIYSAETRRLIAAWQRGIPKDEPDDLNDGDWLCLCQDWDARHFRASVLGTRQAGPGLMQVRVRIDLGEGEHRFARFLMRREGTAWKVDDIFAGDFPRGLKQALRETITKDRRR